MALICLFNVNSTLGAGAEKKIERYANGVKKSEVNLIEGKRVGIALYWYPSGCPMSIHHFVDNQLNGPMVKWENCENIIAIGEYKNDMPWDGYFLVNPSTAIPINDLTVHESVLTYYVMKFTHGEPFTGLSKSMLEEKLKNNSIYKQLLDQMRKPEESVH